jgi:hypothetical protein
MPTNYTPTPEIYDGSAVSTLVDGDAVNRDNLYVEASPGTKLTLGRLLNWIAGLSDGTTGILARLARTTAPAGATLVGLRSYVGTNFTIAAGTLQTWAETLADKAARTDIATIWTATFQVNALTQVNQITALGTTPNDLQGITHLADARIDQAPSLANTAISASATTATIDDTKPMWTAVAWNGSGGTLDVTVSPATVSGARADILFFFDPTSPSHQATFTRYGAGSPFFTVAGKGLVRFRWSGTAYRALGDVVIGEGAAFDTDT